MSHNISKQIYLYLAIQHDNFFIGNKTPPPLTPGSGIQNGLIPPTTTLKKDSVLDIDSSSTRSGRRPSVDTISTYLSHESKDSINKVIYLYIYLWFNDKTLQIFNSYLYFTAIR